MHFLDLGESFQTHIYLQKLASIQPRTSPLTFAGDPGCRRRLDCVSGTAPEISSAEPQIWSTLGAVKLVFGSGVALAGALKPASGGFGMQV